MCVKVAGIKWDGVRVINFFCHLSGGGVGELEKNLVRLGGGS